MAWPTKEIYNLICSESLNIYLFSFGQVRIQALTLLGLVKESNTATTSTQIWRKHVTHQDTTFFSSWRDNKMRSIVTTIAQRGHCVCLWERKKYSLDPILTFVCLADNFCLIHRCWPKQIWQFKDWKSCRILKCIDRPLVQNLSLSKQESWGGR